MGWTVTFISIFGTAALVPAVWAVVGLIRGKRQFWPAVLGTAWAVLLMIATFTGMATDWGGCGFESETGVLACGDSSVDVWAKQCSREPAGGSPAAAGEFCPAGVQAVFRFCEPFQDGAVKQPWATWSDLSFIAAGLWILWWFQFFARAGTTSSDGTTVTVTADNPMIMVGWLPIAYALIVIFMGPPSMWLHASMKAWGGWFDTMSVVIWLSFNACYVLYALAFAMWGNGRGAARPITILSVTAAFVIGFGVLVWNVPSAGLFGYLVAGGLWGVAEIVYIFVAAFASGVVYRRTWWLFLVNFTILAVTMGIWALFNDDIVSAQACQSREGIPGHAIFHILASFATIATFVHFASERKVES